MMASELESDVGPQDTAPQDTAPQDTAASSDNPPPVTLPEDQPVLYRVSTDVEYSSRYVKDADERLKQLTSKIPESEQYFALKVPGGKELVNMFAPNFMFWGAI